MIWRPPSSTSIDTLFPDSTLFSAEALSLRMGALFVAAEGTRRDNGARAPHGREKEILIRPAWNSSAIFNHRRGAPRSRQTRKSEENTSELQSLMRSAYAALCLKQKHA